MVGQGLELGKDSDPDPSFPCPSRALSEVGVQGLEEGKDQVGVIAFLTRTLSNYNYYLQYIHTYT